MFMAFAPCGLHFSIKYRKMMYARTSSNPKSVSRRSSSFERNVLREWVIKVTTPGLELHNPRGLEIAAKTTNLLAISDISELSSCQRDLSEPIERESQTHESRKLILLSNPASPR